jgi:Na+/melibiose symporter-like transporter
VLGLGAESMIVAATTVLAKWFKGKELSFAFGINLTIARLASVAADNSPTWANRVFYPQGPAGEPSWQGPLFLAVGAGVLALICSSVYWALESRAEGRYELGQAGSIDKLEFNQIFRFNSSYWLVVGLCFTFYSAIFPFRTFAIDFFTNKILAAHGGVSASEAMRILAHERAGFFNSLLPLSAMIATPLFGLLADKIGKRAFLMMFGSVLLMPVYLLMGYTNVSLFVPVCMMGVAFSLIPAVMWPSVAYIVDQNRLGTAYALMTLIQQIGFFILNLLIGNANDYSHAGLDNPGGYGLGMWIFSILGFVGLTFAILLRIRETGPQGHGLETITAKA